ncbi:hypothetical protein [Flavobacterium sp. N1736]|uniref:hypothetical protein n=1 Tax=Flavobacterium sp. N1736 TaxID=2986823 RepID=UPI0022245298|nr:hypothetical protein [Flavobacterium sp. N1736]
MKKPILQIIALSSIIILFSCKRTTESVTEVAVDTVAVAIDSIEPKANNNWEYRQSIDKMTSKTTKFAQIRSNESLHLEFPYEGVNYGELTLRNKDGLNIYLSIDKGQISGGYDNNFITVRFDDEKAIKFSYTEPQDGSSNIIFINSEAKFLSKLKKSKKVLIALPVYHDGNQILEFNTIDLKW